MLVAWLLVLLVGTAYLAHRRTAPLPALGGVAADEQVQILDLEGLKQRVAGCHNAARE